MSEEFEDEFEDESTYCDRCEQSVDPDDTQVVTWEDYSMASRTYVTRRAVLCSDCYRTCHNCGDVFRPEDVAFVWDEDYCCDCTTSCDGCGSTIPTGNHYCSDDCRPEKGRSCESPAMAFTIRNDGDDPLPNDTPMTLTLPAGVISEVGIQAIRDYLVEQAGRLASLGAGSPEERDLYGLSYQVYGMDPVWQNKEGNFTKRLSKLAYKLYNLKLKPEIVSAVGCIARDHSKPIDFLIAVTRNLNLSAEEFANEDSCWWGSYEYSRCCLKSNGGFGLRTFRPYENKLTGDTWHEVTGRAWVMPLRKAKGGHLVPTFETLDPTAFVVFNGYGDLDGYAPARMMAHLAGMTYRKVELTVRNMFVNGGSGYLVAPEVIAEPYTDGSLHLDAETHSNLFTDEQADNKEMQYV